MAYSKSTYLDEILSGAERYDIKENGGGAFKTTMQIVLATPVTTSGTPLDASHLNNAENQIDALSTLASTQLLVGDASGVSTKRTITGDVTISNTGVTAITAGSIVNADINAAAGIVGSKLAAAAGITDAQLVRGKVSNRKGGSATDWSTAGVTNYAVGETRIQAGVGTSLATSGVAITYPVAFAFPPIIIVTAISNLGFAVASSSAAVGTVQIVDKDGYLIVSTFSWLAIGPA